MSDLFEDASSLGLPGDRRPCVEVTVRVININKGRSVPIVSRCETLNGYSVFIDKVREYEAETAAGRPSPRLTDDERLAAMKKGINWCIAHDILKDFLEAHRGEVELMLFNEWNLEDALVVEREEGREEGREVREIEIARTALAEGMSFEMIHKLTGLEIEKIEQFAMNN